MSEEIRQEYTELEKRHFENQKAIFKLQRENSEIDQKLIAIKAEHPELFQADVHRPLYGRDLDKKQARDQESR